MGDSFEQLLKRHEELVKENLELKEKLQVLKKEHKQLKTEHAVVYRILNKKLPYEFLSLSSYKLNKIIEEEERISSKKTITY